MKYSTSRTEYQLRHLGPTFLQFVLGTSHLLLVVAESFVKILSCRGVQNKRYFVSKSKQFHFVMRSKPNRERLGSFRETNTLYSKAALNKQSCPLPSHEFSKKDDDTDERQRKNFEILQKEISF